MSVAVPDGFAGVKNDRNEELVEDLGAIKTQSLRFSF